MQAAIALGGYLIPHANAAFDEMGADPEMDAARYVLEWLLSRGIEKISKRDLFEGTKGQFKRVKELEPALAVLEEHGYVRETKADREGPGRKPSPVYEVNPYSHISHNPQNTPRRDVLANTANTAKGYAPHEDAHEPEPTGGESVADIPF